MFDIQKSIQTNELMNNPNFVHITSIVPMKTEVIYVKAPEGMSIAQMLWDKETNRNDLPYTLTVYIDGKPVLAELLDSTYPTAGQLVTISALPKKGALRIILMIVLLIIVVIFAQWAGPALYAAYGSLGIGMTAGAYTAIIVGVGSVLSTLIINALIPPETPKLRGGLSGDQDSPTLWISGARNTENRWGAVPVILGTHRTIPFYGTKPYTEIVGANQYVRCLFVIGYGPLQITDLKLGETPLSDFVDCEVEVRSGYVDDDPITLFPKNVDEESLSILLTYANSWQTRVTKPDIDEFSIDYAFLKGLVYISSNRHGTAKSPTTVQLDGRYRKVGDTDWISFADVTPVTAKTFTLQSSWVDVFDVGFQPANRCDLVCVEKINARVKVIIGSNEYDPPTTPDDSFPLAKVVVNGDSITSVTDLRPGDISGMAVTKGSTPITLIVDVASGTVTYTPRLVITAGSSEAVRGSVLITVPERAQYEVQMRRITADSTQDTLQNESTWMTLRSIKNEAPINFLYPLALVAIRLKATDQLSGMVDEFNCVATSIIKDYVPPASLIKDSVGSTFNRGDFTATNAFFWSSIDLSPYAGTDSGSTPYYIEVLDAAGKKAIGYIGAVGTGEILGNELITNGGMEAGNPPTDWVAIASPETWERSAVQKYAGSYSGHLIDSTVSFGQCRQYFPAWTRLSGQVFKYSLWHYLVLGEVSCIITDGDGSSVVTTLEYTTGSWIQKTGYYGIRYSDVSAGFITFYSPNMLSIEFYVDEVSNKRLTEPPVTAVHIVSSLNGTTRNWASIESGFDANTITSWNIYNSLGYWIEKPTNNNASLYRYVLQGSANPKPCPDINLDLDWFEEFWLFCKDKGYSYNSVISTPRSVPEMIRAICSAGRASPQRSEAKWLGIIDTQQTLISGHYTPHNSWGFEFEGTYPELPHAWRVTFLDAENKWNQAERIVYADGYNEANATLFEAVTQEGITYASQIWKIWRYNYACAQLRPFPFSFIVDWENLTNRRGDLIRASYYELTGQLFTGRLKAVGVVGPNHVLTLDNAVIMGLDKTYGIRLRVASGTPAEISVTGTVITEVGEFTVITISGMLTRTPLVGDLYQFGEMGIESIPAIITKIEALSKLCAKVTCLDYAPEVFDSDTQDIPPWNPVFNEPSPMRLVSPPVPVIESVVSDESQIVIDPGKRFRFRIAVNFRIPGIANVSAQSVQIQYYPVLTPQSIHWVTLDIVTAQTGVAYIPDVNEGAEYQIRIRSVSRTGMTSAWSAEYHETVIGRTSIPPDVTGLTYSFTTKGIMLIWSLIDLADISYYDVRYGGSDWDDASPIAQVASDKFEWGVQTAGNYIVRIKAVDFLNLESENETTAQIQIVGPAAPQNLTSTTIINQVLLYWTPIPGSFPISYSVILNGALEEIGNVGGTFIAFFESLEGDYTYYIKSVDIAGNVGATSSINVHLQIPPDFILYDEVDLNLTSGTFSNSVHKSDVASIYMPVNITETHDGHFTTGGWASWQAKITAGYPRWLQPTSSNGEYTIVYDTSVTIPSSIITVIPNLTHLVVGCTMKVFLSVSLNGSDYTTEVEALAILGTNFRYVKTRIRAEQGSNLGLVQLQNIHLSLNIIRKTDSGIVESVSTDIEGTWVPFNEDFTDVKSIIVTAAGPTQAYAVYGFNEIYGDNCLLHLNGSDESTTITDEYGHTWTVSGNAKLDTGDKKFGSASLELDGNGDFIYRTFTTFGSKWTREGWFHTDNIDTANQAIWTAYCDPEAYGVFLMFHGTNKKFYFAASSNGATWDIADFVNNTGPSIVNGTWYKWVVEFDGTHYRIWIGASGALTLVIDVTSSLEICEVTYEMLGAYGSWYLDGGIDEFRGTDGIYRYGTVATAETAEFFVDSGIGFYVKVFDKDGVRITRNVSWQAEGV